MASDGYPVQIPASNPLHGSQAVSSVGIDRGSKSQPVSGKTPAAPTEFATAAFAVTDPAAAASAAPVSPAAASVFKSTGTAAAPTAPAATSSYTAALAAKASASALKAPEQRASDPTVSATQLNKSLNDSGRPDQFRIDPASDTLIQQINPANGEVIGQYSIDEFPALAQSIGATGLLVDALA